MHVQAKRLIDELELRAHPEGGWYRETFRSAALVTTAQGLVRSALTSIYFLLCAERFSAFHALASDETWHFYAGDPIVLEVIAPGGTHERRVLGEGGTYQTTICAGAHFAAHVDVPGGYALAGCNVAPGFEFADFSLPAGAQLSAAYPHLRNLIERYTR